MGVFEKNKKDGGEKGQSQNPPPGTNKDGESQQTTQGAAVLPPGPEGTAATEAEGPGDQGHGEGDSKKTALEQTQALRSVDQGSQARGVLLVSDPNPHERFDAAGYRTNTRYQSEDARAALLNPDDAQAIQDRGIRDAEIGSNTPEVQQAIDLESLNKKVIVKPRQTINRFRIGDTWYSLKDGEETLVPQHVALVLAEKGIV